MAVFGSHLVAFILILSAVVVVVVSAQGSNKTKTTKWKTLSGDAPLVVARGGFSGLFPDSSSYAYDFTLATSLSNVIVLCDVQLTKDGAGVCLPNIMLDGITSVGDPGAKKYSLNGVPTTGHFSIDYTLDDLGKLSLMQGILYRTDIFDGICPILTVEDVVLKHKPPGLWLNIQHDAFFTQHNLSMRSFVLSVSRRVIVNYLSSPEVGFLRSIVARFNKSRTKLIFRFLEIHKIEPSTKQTYGSLLKNLKFVKTFSSGILVPKNYIWPVNSQQYLQPHTSLVADAHREGLEVFASDFANDVPFSYNYSYDPVAEYLSFVDSGDFSVDGVLSDFPITPSAAIGCFSDISKNTSGQALPTIISHNGASGVYPDSTDRAYNQAVEDGADYIDCSVQMTSDGIPICLSSINLMAVSTVTQSPFSNLGVTIPEVQANTGIFTFNLTWKDIQSLKPMISIVKGNHNLTRNPANRNAGSFISLDNFLTFAKSKRLAGILINIENAAYLAEKQGMSVTDSVLDALGKSGYNNQTDQEVIIGSTSKAVLMTFKRRSKYKCMYNIDEDISNADDSSIKDIKSFADSVAVSKKSVFPQSDGFTTGSTNIVRRLQSFNLTVYVYVFMNEFVTQAWDFFSDPVVEINSYVMVAGINGVITDFPGTAAAYRRNRCLTMGVNLPAYMNPVEPGSLIRDVPTQQLPPAEAPNPILTESDVAESPLPPVSRKVPNSSTSGSAQGPNAQNSNSSPHVATCILLSSLSTILACLLMH